jgi:hypothetical protein
MNAVIRKNLTDALAVDANDVDTVSDTSGAFGDGRDRARFCRTIATCIWGVSDPLPTGPGTGSGGWQRGSLTPQMPPSLLPTAALTSTRAAKSAARLTAVKSNNGQDIAEVTALVLTLYRHRLLATEQRATKGTTAPASVVPLLFFAFVNSTSAQRRENSRRKDSIEKP